MRGSRQRPAVHRPLPSAATVTGGRRAGQRRLHGHGFRWQRPEASPRPSGRPNLRHRAQASRPPPVPSRRPSALAPRPCKRVAGATRSARTIRPDGTRPPGMQRAAPRPGARRRRTGRVRWATYARLVGSCLLPRKTEGSIFKHLVSFVKLSFFCEPAATGGEVMSARGVLAQRVDRDPSARGRAPPGDRPDTHTHQTAHCSQPSSLSHKPHLPREGRGGHVPLPLALPTTPSPPPPPP